MLTLRLLWPDLSRMFESITHWNVAELLQNTLNDGWFFTSSAYTLVPSAMSMYACRYLKWDVQERLQGYVGALYAVWVAVAILDGSVVAAFLKSFDLELPSFLQITLLNYVAEVYAAVLRVVLVPAVIYEKACRSIGEATFCLICGAVVLCEATFAVASIRRANEHAAELRRLADEQFETQRGYRVSKSTVYSQLSPSAVRTLDRATKVELFRAYKTLPAFEMLLQIQEFRAVVELAGNDPEMMATLLTLEVFLKQHSQPRPTLLKEYFLVISNNAESIASLFRRFLPRSTLSTQCNSPPISLLRLVKTWPALFLLLHLVCSAYHALKPVNYNAPFRVLMRATLAIEQKVSLGDGTAVQAYLQMKFLEPRLVPTERRSHAAILDAVLSWKARKTALEIQRLKQALGV
ncbi:hypothetical protein JCM6882_000327 [Rhodosporidiobolus microsporus]